MLARRQRDDHWCMELLEFDHPEFDPFYMHPLYRGDLAVGMVTSASYGHRLQKAVGLAYLQTPLHAAASLEVEILGRRTGARVIAPL